MFQDGSEEAPPPVGALWRAPQPSPQGPQCGPTRGPPSGAGERGRHGLGAGVTAPVPTWVPAGEPSPPRGSIRFPPYGFKHCFTLFPKSFSSFPHGTCSLSVSCPYLALDEVYHPLRAALPSSPTRRGRATRGGLAPGPRTGLSPSLVPRSRGLGPRGPPGSAPLGQRSARAARGLVPWASPASLAATEGILVSFFSSA